MAGTDLGVYLAEVQAGWLGREPDRTWAIEDATLVFADVSGFTPLTERLARAGRVGAELLTDVLNEVFSDLLGVAASFGGDLLKFGGDALFLLYRGEEHERRGAAAAHALQRAIRRYRRTSTPAGRVSLRMSVGLETGPVALFLVGSSHRELLIGGPTVSTTAALEGAAGADEVLVGPEAASRLGRTHLGGVVGPGVLLDAPPRVTPARRPAATYAIDPAVGIPAPLREHLGRSGYGEHRRCVLTFLRFQGLDGLLADHGPERAAEALDELVTVVQAACESHGVTFLASDVDRDGGKLLLVAGAPTATPDDADRMLFVLRDVLDAGTTLSVRAGVNRGRAFAVDVGSPDRRTFAVMGDATNLAARVMGRAEPGTVLATASVVANLRTRFALTPLEPFTVKGKSKPVHAHLVGRIRGGTRTPGADERELPLVGREAELTLLTGLVDRARRGSGGVVELVGEPGVGKSRLLSDLDAVSRDVPRFAVEGAQYARSSPYFALRAPLRRLLGQESAASDERIAERLAELARTRLPLLEPWLTLVAVPFGVELPETPETAGIDPALRAGLLHRMVDDVVRLLLPGPALITVEDAHWLDDASAEILRGLAERAVERSWAVIVARRDAPTRLALPADGTSVDLRPLDDGATEILARTAADDLLLPPATLGALVERCAGNPLFLRELIETVRSGGDVDALPDTVEASVAARIDTLAPGDRLLLRYAAVIGGRVDVGLLGQMVAGEPGLPPLAPALRRMGHFLASDGPDRMRFRHAVLRDVAYEGLAFRLRRSLHDRAGRLIERRAGAEIAEWADLLSFHYDAAGDAPRAWTFSRLAGDRAREHAAPAEAATFYRRALRAARSLPDVRPEELAAVHEAYGDVAHLAGDHQEAVAAYRQTRRLDRADPVRLADLCRKEGVLREHFARSSDALRWFTRGLRTLAAARPTPASARIEAELTLAYGATRLRQGRYVDALPLLRSAVAQAETLGARRVLAHAYYLLDWALTDLGDPESARYRALALPIYEELGDFAGQANVLNNVGVDAYYEGRWDEALELYERSRAARVRAGDLVQLGTSANNIGEIRSDQGMLEVAEELFREALAIWRSTSYPVGAALATSNLGRAAARGGDPERASALLAEARESFDAIGTEAFVSETEARIAEAAVLRGDGAAALDAIEGVEAKIPRLGEVPVLRTMLLRLRGYARVLGGQHASGVSSLRAAVEVARAHRADYELALGLEAIARTAGLTGAPDGGAADREAREILRRLGVVRTPTVPLVVDPVASSATNGADPSSERSRNGAPVRS